MMRANEQANGREREHGATLVEYGLLLMMVTITCIAAINALGHDVAGAFSSIANAI